MCGGGDQPNSFRCLMRGYLMPFRRGAVAMLIFCVSSVYAGEQPDNYEVSDQSENCWLSAARTYNVNPYLLYAIAEKESALNPLAVNARGSMDEDVGLMQINSFWYPHLEKYGISRSDLFDSCTSIQVGAWVLAQSMNVFGNTWEAVGAYNVGTSKEAWAYKARNHYASDVQRRYLYIVKRMHEFGITASAEH